MNPPQVYMCSPSWTLLPPPSPFHPSGSSQCTSPKHPVSCIEPGLATRLIHDILQVSMPFSQIFPPSPSLTESKKYGTLHEFACHPCAGAMLIFSVSFQFSYMCCRSEHPHLVSSASPARYQIKVHSSFSTTLQSLKEFSPFKYFFFLGFYHSWFGEGNGNPLQYSCLANPMDGGDW